MLFRFRGRAYLLAALILACGLGFTAPAAGQVGGVITGTIADAQGGVLPGVTVTVRNIETGLTRTLVTEAEGLYRVSALPPGQYELKAELEGFATVEVKGLVLVIGGELQKDVTMAVAGLEESVTVTAQVALVEKSKAEISAVVTQQQIQTLPIADRQPVMLALLLPGTSQDGIRPRRANANVGAGATFYSNQFLMDGAMTTALKAGEPRQDFPQASIREFKVNVSQATAEYGGNLGGIVSIVTKSGTNRYSGEAFEFFRHKSLNAMNVFEKKALEEKGIPKPDFRRFTSGMSLGGPIITDRLHFFGAYERTDQRQNMNVYTGKPEFYSALEGSFPNNYLNWMAFARGDMQITPNQTLFVRYSYMKRFLDCEGCGGSNAAFSSTASNLPADQTVAGHTWVLSSRAVNEIRWQGPAHLWQHSAPPGYDVWTKPGQYPAERYTGMTAVYQFPSLTWGSASSSIFLSKYWEFRDDFTVTANWQGSHAVKIGGSFLDIHGLDDTGAMGLGTWTFTTDQYFNPNDPASLANLRNPSRFTNSLPPTTRRFRPKWYSVYVTDEWKPLSNLTLNLGLRYDLQKDGWNEDLDMSVFPREIPFADPSSRRDYNNVGPRLGLAWDVGSRGTTVVKGGYGRYYQNTRQTVGANERSNLLTTNITINRPTYPDPYQGRDPLSFANQAAQNITIVSNDIRNASADTVNVGFTRQLAEDLAVDVDFVYTRTRNMEVAVAINTPDPITNLVPMPGWSRISEVQAVGTQRYRALMVRVDKRFSNRYLALASYTLGKIDDNTGGGTQSATPTLTDFYHPGFDTGPGPTDRRHNFVGSGSVLLPWDVTLGAVWTVRSTMPFSAIAGVDLNGDGMVTDYVPGTTRNQGNRNLDMDLVNAWRATRGLGPIDPKQIDKNTYNRIDLRGSRSIDLGGDRKIELIGQVFNVLGTDNLLGIGSGWVTNALSDAFGVIPSAQPRQQAELAVRFAW
jgi:outer membrane receptor protein involved in Fe transport